jgi:predicted nucleic acid-binding protein
VATAKSAQRSLPSSSRKKTRPAEKLGDTRYIESSALLSALLENDETAIRALRVSGRRVTSAITLAEANRAVVRARVAGRLTLAQERDAIRALQTFERRTIIVNVSDWVLARAGHPFPIEPVRTLDAIHLATAELLSEPPQLVTVVTRDRRVAENAKSLGYRVE